MTFTEKQKTELAGPLNKAHVKPPAPGKYGDYIEGWRVIDEANRIFGFDGWTRETVEMVEVCRLETKIGRNQDDGWMVGYRAKVRVDVGGVIREGSAVGNGEARKLYDAVESAVKEAETDAMKRALMTFGNPFGLALYDKSHSNVQTFPEAIPDSVRTALLAIGQIETKLMLKKWWTENGAAIPDSHAKMVADAIDDRAKQIELMDRSAA